MTTITRAEVQDIRFPTSREIGWDNVLMMDANQVCAGGAGLCEYVQHISLFDCIAAAGSLEGRVLEYVDHLHEHFVDPVAVERGRYRVPEAPGYSITMHAESLARHRFPDGAAWQEES